MKKGENGITLIALVVTIIILLILAGVTLATALSQNGLFQRAKDARNEWSNAVANESEVLTDFENQVNAVWPTSE